MLKMMEVPSLMWDGFVKVCPRCGSTDVQLDTELFMGIVQDGEWWYKCNRCGFTSNSFPDMTPEEARAFEAKLGWKPDKKNRNEP